MPYLSLTCIDKRLGEVDEPSSRSAALKTATAVLRSRACNTRDRDDDAVRPWSDRGQPEWIPNVPQSPDKSLLEGRRPDEVRTNRPLREARYSGHFGQIFGGLYEAFKRHCRGSCVRSSRGRSKRVNGCPCTDVLTRARSFMKVTMITSIASSEHCPC